MGPASAHTALTPQSVQARVLGILAWGLVALGIDFCFPPIPQDMSYHAFADERTILGIPNFLNVSSNLPFILVGVLGMVELFRARANVLLIDQAERWPWLVFFTGVLLTGFGSSYYHLAPDNDRLVWDRLPMTIAFMGFFAATIAERIRVQAGTWLLAPLVWLGFASVFSWHMGERHDAGDLRLYGFVQFYPLVTIPLMLYFFPARYTLGSDIIVTLGWYLLAKVLEVSSVDHGIYNVGQVVSGHTLKHVAAALGAYWLYRMVKLRQPSHQPAV